jgi:hypothetical protein
MSTNTFNVTLTNYARGLAQELDTSLASFIAPEVVVPAATGQYKNFSDKNNFQVHDTARAIGGTARRLQFSATDPTYNCLPQALEVAIDDHERAQAGDGDPLGLEEAKTKTLIQSALTSHEQKVFSSVAAAVAAEAGVGVWSNDANDPIAEIDAFIEEITTETGKMPNRIVMGLPAWAAVRHNAKVIDRFPGAAQIGVSTGQFSSLLLNPEIELRIGVMSYDQNKFGNVNDNANVVGSETYIFQGQDSPSLYDPSFCKTFRTRSGGVDVVRTYREDSSRSDVIAIDWSEDFQVTSAVCAKRITVS